MDLEEKDTSKRILQATLKRISTYGYANVSMRDIAEEASVALSQLNYYYKNKEKLFIAVIQHIKNEYLQDIENQLKTTKTAQEKISFLVDYCQKVIKENNSIYKLILDFYSMSIWSKAIEAEFKLFFHDIAEVIGKYITSDTSINDKIKSYPPQLITRLLIATTFGIAMQHFADEDNNEIIKGLDIIKTLI